MIKSSREQRKKQEMKKVYYLSNRKMEGDAAERRDKDRNKDWRRT